MMRLRATAGLPYKVILIDEVTGQPFGIATSLNNIEEETEEIETHLHSHERWFGLAGTPDAEVHRADRIGVTVNPFVMDAEDDDWGLWLQILGSDDTPAVAGKAYFDLHRIFISAVERSNSVHFIQIANGSSGAAALTANSYTEVVYKPSSAAAEEVAIIVQSNRHAAGTKAWVRVFIPGQVTGTVNFWIGLHEYDA